MPHSNGSTGSTLADCRSPSDPSRQQQPRGTSSPFWKDQTWPRSQDRSAAAESSAVHNTEKGSSERRSKRATCINASAPHTQTNQRSRTFSWSRPSLMPKTAKTDTAAPCRRVATGMRRAAGRARRRCRHAGPRGLSARDQGPHDPAKRPCGPLPGAWSRPPFRTTVTSRSTPPFAVALRRTRPIIPTTRTARFSEAAHLVFDGLKPGSTSLFKRLAKSRNLAWVHRPGALCWYDPARTA